MVKISIDIASIAAIAFICIGLTVRTVFDVVAWSYYRLRSWRSKLHREIKDGEIQKLASDEVFPITILVFALPIITVFAVIQLIFSAAAGGVNNSVSIPFITVAGLLAYARLQQSILHENETKRTLYTLTPELLRKICLESHPEPCRVCSGQVVPRPALVRKWWLIKIGIARKLRTTRIVQRWFVTSPVKRSTIAVSAFFLLIYVAGGLSGSGAMSAATLAFSLLCLIVLRIGISTGPSIYDILFEDWNPRRIIFNLSTLAFVYLCQLNLNLLRIATEDLESVAIGKPDENQIFSFALGVEIFLLVLAFRWFRDRSIRNLGRAVYLVGPGLLGFLASGLAASWAWAVVLLVLPLGIDWVRHWLSGISENDPKSPN